MLAATQLPPVSWALKSVLRSHCLVKNRLTREAVDARLPGSAQGQAGWGFEQPGLVEGVPACGREVGTR